MPIEVTSYRPRRRDSLKNATVKVREGARWAARCGTAARCVGAFAALALIAGVALFSYFYFTYSAIIDRQLAAGFITNRAGIYASPRVLRPGAALSREQLVEALGRAGYIENNTSDVWSGGFTVREGAVEIQPRRSEGAPEVVRVDFSDRGRISTLTADQVSIGSYQLEPELLTSDGSMKTGSRRTLAYKDIPPHLARAVLAIEDRRFFDHHGVDLAGVARALVRNTSDRSVVQGGSTITQQLVKNTYLTPERTLRRKFNEAVLASVLERRLSKEDIFALYCNEVYLGQRGATGVRGVEQAARVFFGKELKDLSLAEAATIAGMIQSPNRHSPERNPEQARERRQVVLAAMTRDGAITAEEAAAAGREEVSISPAESVDTAVGPYFLDYINRAIEAELQVSGRSDARDLRVYTTIDLELQRLAEQVMAERLAKLDKVYKGRATPQAALVAIDPHTGHVLAMVGGRDYAESQLNRATDARRQPGSVFKPVVYAAAVESGLSPLSLYSDTPHAFVYDRRKQYRPANYGGGYSMRDVTMRTALTRSLNVVTVDIAMRTGLTRVAALSEKFGLPKPEPYPALALGTTEVTPLEMASAYTAFANSGEVVAPVVIASAVDSAGVSLVNQTGPEKRRAIRPETAYMITNMLEGVINHGTARAARGSIKGTAVAGKTGTSRDGWFVGYTPNLVCAVWTGFDDNKQLGLTGAEAALPAWVDFVKGAVSLRPELGGENFLRPAGVTTVEIDPETGMLASPSCPARERVALASGYAPHYPCYTHNPPLPLMASAEMEESSDPAAAVDNVRSALATDSPAGTEPPHTAGRADLPPAPPAPAVPHQPLVNSAQVEVDERGRRVLTNTIRVNDTAGTAP